MNRKEGLTARFRKVAWGKLHWKSDDTMREHFDSDDVCIVRDGTATIHYKTIEAFIADLEEWEMWEAIVVEDMKESETP